MCAYSFSLNTGAGLLCYAAITTWEIAISCSCVCCSLSRIGVCTAGNAKQCGSTCTCSARCFPYSFPFVLPMGWWPPSPEGLSITGIAHPKVQEQGTGPRRDHLSWVQRASCESL